MKIAASLRSTSSRSDASRPRSRLVVTCAALCGTDLPEAALELSQQLDTNLALIVGRPGE